MRILVTGGCGFIGSNFLNLMVRRYPRHEFLNLDVLGYAANPLSVEGIACLPNYGFVRADLGDGPAVARAVEGFEPDWVFHFAAESHVDRSIRGPEPFVRSNIVGTFNLLEACREAWKDRRGKVFLHVSTDEVFGELGAEGKFTEETPYDPSSPYSASKASSDLLVRAWWKTFDLPVKVTNCSNNYGPYQFPEKLVPLMTLNAMEDKALPVYGKGENVRDWLFVRDHCEALWAVAERGRVGETYCIGGESERSNMDVVRGICASVARRRGCPVGDVEGLVTYVTDRPGHDFRYAIDISKIRSELGWEPSVSFESGLDQTVGWYFENQEWLASVTSGSYLRWIDEHYGEAAVGP